NHIKGRAFGKPGRPFAFRPSGGFRSAAFAWMRCISLRLRLQRLGSVLGRAATSAKVARSIDQRDVGDRLRKVAELATRARVVFLGQQAYVVAQREQAREQCLGFGAAPRQRQRVSGASRWYRVADLIARSTATQAMTLEWVKCRRSPRTSQIPLSGCSQLFSRKSTSTRSNRHASSSGPRPAVRATESASITSP